MPGRKRTNLKYGMSVAIVLKQDQDTGYLTDGIKVRLMSGEVGRVKEVY